MTYRTDSPMVGAERVAYRQHSHQTPMSTNHGVTNNLVQRGVDFLELANELVAKVAREALEKNPSLSPKLKEQLRDAERGRYGNKLVALLLEAMQGHTNALSLADHAKEASLQVAAQSVVPCILDTYISNTRAQKDADVAQALFLIERTPARQDQLLDTLGPEEVTLHFHKLAVAAWNPSAKRVFAQ